MHVCDMDCFRYIDIDRIPEYPSAAPSVARCAFAVTAMKYTLFSEDSPNQQIDDSLQLFSFKRRFQVVSLVQVFCVYVYACGQNYRRLDWLVANVAGKPTATRRALRSPHIGIKRERTPCRPSRAYTKIPRNTLCNVRNTHHYWSPISG